MSRLLSFFSSISVGLVLVAFWGWLLYNAESFVTTNPEAFRDLMFKNILFTTLIFSIDAGTRYKAEKGIFSISLLKGIPKFLMTLIVTIIFFALMGTFLKSNDFPRIINFLTPEFSVIIIIHAIIIAIPEELAFRGFFTNLLKEKSKLKLWHIAIITSVLFGLYHFAIDRGNILSMGIHSLMGLVFFIISQKGLPLLNKIPKIGKAWFGASSDTQMTNSGFHAGWNLFVIGLLR